MVTGWGTAVPGRRYLIGTDPVCDIRIPKDRDPYVSPRHAAVWRDQAGRVWVEDLGSTNGTNIVRISGGARVQVRDPTPLHPGDTVLVGRTALPWPAPTAGPRVSIVEPFERGWRSRCPKCPWTSQDLPFPDPDAALHALSLHDVLCRGGRP